MPAGIFSFFCLMDKLPALLALYIDTGVSDLDGAGAFTISAWINTSYTGWQYLIGDNSFLPACDSL